MPCLELKILVQIKCCSAADVKQFLKGLSLIAHVEPHSQNIDVLIECIVAQRSLPADMLENKQRNTYAL